MINRQSLQDSVANISPELFAETIKEIASDAKEFHVLRDFLISHFETQYGVQCTQGHSEWFVCKRGNWGNLGDLSDYHCRTFFDCVLWIMGECSAE